MFTLWSCSLHLQIAKVTLEIVFQLVISLSLKVFQKVPSPTLFLYPFATFKTFCFVKPKRLTNSEELM